MRFERVKMKTLNLSGRSTAKTEILTILVFVLSFVTCASADVDLYGISSSMSPTTLTAHISGQSFEISQVVGNKGIHSAGAFNVHFILKKFGEEFYIDVGETRVNGVGAGASVTATWSGYFPTDASPGTYYLWQVAIDADNEVYEPVESNNTFGVPSCLIYVEESAIVPDVVGMTLDEARMAISNAGLVLWDISYANSNTVPQGKVISQDLAAETLVKQGTTMEIVISSGPSGGPVGPGAGGLVAHYKLDETAGTIAADSSGNSNNGTLFGGPIWQPDGGILNGALQFDGVNDYVDCNNASILNIQDKITLACWIKIAAFTRAWQAVLAKGDDSYLLCRSSVGNSIHFGLTGTSLGGFDGAAVVADSNWHHVAGVYDGADAMLYVDGVPDTAIPCTGQINTSNYKLFIGENSQIRGRYLKGLVDDVRIYSKALSEAEVVAAMSGTGAETTGPVAHWGLDETSGTVAADSSGNGNNGTLYGGALWQPTGGKLNGALQFDGVNDYVDCNNPSILNIQDKITLACWIKIASFTRLWQAILAKGDDSYRLCRSSAGDSIYMGITGTSVGGFDGAAVVADNQWHHVAGVYDGSEGTLYIDGVLDTVVPATGRINASTYKLFIGENSQARGRYLKGLVDDVRIYDCALSEVDVAELAGILGPVGPVQATVPNVVGMTQAAAQSAITSAGLIVGNVTQASSNTIPQGIVISQNPAAGTLVESGSSVSLVISSGPSGGPGVNGLVAHWKLDEALGTAAADSSGNGRNGTLYGGPVWQPTSGKVNGALRFDGSNDYVSLPIGSLISTLSDCTIATWVNWSGTGGNWQRIFDFGSSTQVSMYLTPSNGNTGSLRFAITISGETNEDQATAPQVLPTGWHHVAVTIDAANKKHILYLDGTVIAQNTTARYTPSSLGNTTQNCLGKSQWPDPYLNGSLDDFRIYNRVLSLNDITQLWAGGLVGN
jgi:hypothetical protein